MEKSEFLKSLARVQLICETVGDLMSISKNEHFVFTSGGILKGGCNPNGVAAGKKAGEAENAFWWVHDNYDSASASVQAAALLAQSADNLLEELYDAAKEGLE